MLIHHPSVADSLMRMLAASCGDASACPAAISRGHNDSDARENNPQLSDFSEDFNFDQPPLPPLIRCYTSAGPALKPGR